MRRSLLAAALAATLAAYAQPDGELTEDEDDVTVEAIQALKYHRCEDALNLLADRERSADTLSRVHRQLKAEAFTCLGSYKTALAIYSDLLKEEANNPSYLYRRARLHGMLGQWKQAYADCARLRLLKPDGNAHCKPCGEYALNAKKYREAVAFLSDYLSENSGDTEARYSMAMAQRGQKNFTQALLLINECLAANPAEGKYYAARAQLYEQTEAHRFAAEDYHAYLAQNPADHNGWLQYAHLLRKLGRKAEACKAFKQSEIHGNLDAGRYLYRYCK
ncbi:MAG: tetratricopeptide repeat protein [Prevotellaceae bacterium]|jgi:predicted Zn-dependent protease|nr:tetratricopeptide repeat protein [Prevotellaceae bacterium]